jgi:hypothetical protein
MRNNLSGRNKQMMQLDILQAGDMMVEGIQNEHLPGLMGVFELRPEAWINNRPVYQSCGLQKKDLFLFYSASMKKWWIAHEAAMRAGPEKVGGFITMCRADSRETVTPDQLEQTDSFWRVAPGDGKWYKTPKLRIRRCRPGEKDKHIEAKREHKRTALDQAVKIGDIVLDGAVVAAEHAHTLGTYKMMPTECVNERPVYSLTPSLSKKKLFLYYDELAMWRVGDNAENMRLGKAEGKLASASNAMTPSDITEDWREICTNTGAWPVSPKLHSHAQSPMVMSVKQLRTFIEKSGGSHASCIEKPDLQKVAWEIVKKKGGAVLADQTSQRNNSTTAVPSKQAKAARLGQTSESDVISMGVKQLQDFLTGAGETTAECVEKADLLRKAIKMVRKSSMKERLLAFYQKHNPEKIADVGGIVDAVQDEAQLNQLLSKAYGGKDLSSISLPKTHEAAAAEVKSEAGNVSKAALNVAAQEGGGIHSSLKENSVRETGAVSTAASPARTPFSPATKPAQSPAAPLAARVQAKCQPPVVEEVAKPTTEARHQPALSSPKPTIARPHPAPTVPSPAPRVVMSPVELMGSWLQELGVPKDKSLEYAETLCEQGFDEPAELIDAGLDASQLSGEPFKFMYKFANKVARECMNPQLQSSFKEGEQGGGAQANSGTGGSAGSVSDSAEVLQLKRRLQQAEAAAAESAEVAAKALSSAPPPSPRGRAGSEWVLAGWEVPSNDIQKLRPLGRGSFGEVMLVRVRGVQMAGKCLTSVSGGGHESAVSALLKELRPMAELLHKHIVRLWGACTEPGELCILMEYMERGSLREVLDTHPHLPPALRFRLLHGIVLGMAHAHAHRPCPVLHRDLKSANILVGSDWRSVVGDLGLATGAGATLSKTNTVGGVAGTLAYSAPEVLNDKKWTMGGDVYSFGVLAYETITGKVPFMGYTVVELVMAVVAKAQRCHNQGDDQPLRQQDLTVGTLSGCNGVMAEVMLKAWAQQVENRPSFEDIRSLFELAEEGIGGGLNSECAAELAHAATASDPAAPVVPRVAAAAVPVVQPAVDVGGGNCGGAVDIFHSAVDVGGGCSAGDDPKFEPYHKMRKMKLPDGAIRQKMMTNGESEADIATFFGSTAAPAHAVPRAAAPAPAPAPAPTAGLASGGKFAPFDKLRKMGLPDAGIIQKMRMAGLSEADVQQFVGGGVGAGANAGANSGSNVGSAARPVAPSRPAMGALGGAGGLMAQIKAKKGGGLKKAAQVEKKPSPAPAGGGGMMAMIAAGVKLKKTQPVEQQKKKPAAAGGGGMMAMIAAGVKLKKTGASTTDSPTKGAERRPSGSGGSGGSGGGGGGGFFSDAVQARIDMQRRAIHDTRDDIHETQDWDMDA